MKQRTGGFFRFPYHLFSTKANKEKKLTNLENPFAFPHFLTTQTSSTKQSSKHKKKKKKKKENGEAAYQRRRKIKWLLLKVELGLTRDKHVSLPLG